MEAANPSGLCECGCGQRTRIATRNDRTTDRVKGRPMRYVHGHHGRGNQHRKGMRSPQFRYGYYFHPRLRRWIINGRNGLKVYYYRAVMEAHLGRHLADEEVVHHINGDPSDDRIENLELFANDAEHQRAAHERGVH